MMRFTPETEDEILSISDNSKIKERTGRRILLKCDICPKTFYTQHCMDAHQRRHQGLSGHPCTFENCNRAYNRITDLKRHLNEHSGIPNVFKCSIDNCTKVFSAYSALNYHKRKHHKHGKELRNRTYEMKMSKDYICETCGKAFSNTFLLKSHRLLHVDKSEWPYVCNAEGCTMRFRSMERLKIHSMRHSGIKNFVCPHCGVRKTTKNELNIHVNFHTFERKYPCRLCPKVFKSVGMVSTHIRMVHEGKRPHSKPTIKPVNSNVAFYECSFCDRTFRNPLGKKYHEIGHTGEEPYACKECDATFSTPMRRYLHMQKHLKGEKPYECKECGKQFKVPGSLRSHKKLHVEGATPYTCAECGQSFRWPGSYYAHKKKHVKKDIVRPQ